jgi:hypothetical protein
MASEDQDRLTITEHPVVLVLVGVLLIFIGLFNILQKGGMIPGLLALVVGILCALVLASTTSITCDKTTNLMTIQYHSIIRNSVKEYPLMEIASMDVESTTSRTRSGSSRTYRLVIIQKSGSQVPLHSYYSSGFSGKKKKAQKINEFLGRNSPITTPASPLQVLSQAMHPSFQLSQEGDTDGIRWVVETSIKGPSNIIRWSSQDFQLPGQFLLLTQKPQGMSDFKGSGLLGGLTNLLYKEVLGVYGFQEGDTPDLEKAAPLALSDARLADDFSSFTNNPDTAQQLLTPWVSNRLAEWVQQYPLQKIQPGDDGQPGQLVILFSPERLYVVVVSKLSDEVVANIISLGVILAREVR